mgnify:CR=1 FL=1
MVGGVLVVALRLVGRVSAMFHPVPSLEEQVAAGVRLRVVAREAGGTVIWKIADTDGAVLPGSWPTPEEATRTARAAEAIMRDVEV